jgi:hypothetical protein
MFNDYEYLSEGLTFTKFELLVVVFVEEGGLGVGGAARPGSHRPVGVLQ